MNNVIDNNAVIAKNLNQPIVLIGLMGAGKTTIGQMLAEQLGVEFTDSDHVLEAKQGRSIPEIFEQEGEPYFRDAERDNIREILNSSKPCVLGTGGGAFMNDETRALILDNTLSVFLSAHLDELVTRVGNGEGRPLFDGKNPRDVLADLIEARYPVYAQATITVETGNESAQETTDKVINALYKHLSPE